MAKPRPPVVDHALELFEGIGGVQARAMFGGWGFYCGDVMFGLIAHDAVHLRVDEINRAEFEAAGSEPFVYGGRKDARPVEMPYFQAPDEAMDTSEAMAPWAQGALEAARRARAAKPKRKPKKRA